MTIISQLGIQLRVKQQVRIIFNARRGIASTQGGGGSWSNGDSSLFDDEDGRSPSAFPFLSRERVSEEQFFCQHRPLLMGMSVAVAVLGNGNGAGIRNGNNLTFLQPLQQQQQQQQFSLLEGRKARMLPLSQQQQQQLFMPPFSQLDHLQILKKKNNKSYLLDVLLNSSLPLPNANIGPAERKRKQLALALKMRRSSSTWKNMSPLEKLEFSRLQAPLKWQQPQQSTSKFLDEEAEEGETHLLDGEDDGLVYLTNPDHELLASSAIPTSPSISISITKNTTPLTSYEMITILKRRRKKMNKHKWKKFRREVRNSTRYNPEKVRKREKERRRNLTVEE